MIRGKGWLVMVGLLVGLWWPVSGRATDKDATSSLPDSIDAYGLFNTSGKISNGDNSAKLVARNHGLQVTDDAKNKMGSVWSLDRQKIDMGHDFVLPMWLYLGKGGVKKSGQGMAFVLQNMSDHEFAEIQSGKQPGQSLGVWGSDWDNTLTDSHLVANMAIPQSWALEFDEQANNSRAGGDNNGFDYSLVDGDQHIDSNYPGELATYARLGTQSSGSKYFYRFMPQEKKMIHATLSDSKWHHLTLRWTAPVGMNDVGEMQYSFDDVPKPQKEKQVTVPIDLSKLGVHAIDQDKHVFWGFTGDTGNLTANNVVALEHIPDFVNSSVTATVRDETQNCDVADSSRINSGDEMTYQFKLHYDGGSQDWQSIHTKIPVPSGLSFETGTIRYPQLNATESIPPDELNATVVKHPLGKNLSAENSEVIITLKGKLVNELLLAVPSSHAVFAGQTDVNTADTPSFTSYPKRSWVLMPYTADGTTADETVEDGQDYVAKLLLMMGGNDIYPSDDDLHLHVTINKEKSFDTALTGTRVTDENGFIHYEVPISTDNLKVGTNELTYMITDELGNKSTTFTKNVTVTEPKGILTFSQVNDSSSFKKTMLTGAAQLISRQDDWNVGVADTLSQKPQWTVTAQAAPFFKKNLLGMLTSTPLLGSAVWLNDQNEATPLNEAVRVASGTSSTPNLVTDWKEPGILLGINGDALPGTYSGQITWTLANAD